MRRVGGGGGTRGVEGEGGGGGGEPSKLCGAAPPVIRFPALTASGGDIEIGNC